MDKHVSIDYPHNPLPTAVWKLNDSLKRGLWNRTHDTHRKILWKAYRRVKKDHPDAFIYMPDEGWNLLWAIQSHRSPINDSRMVHMKQLADHQEEFGTSTLRKAYLDALIPVEQRKKAASQWIKMYKSSSDPVVEQPEFLEHGVKVVANAGMFQLTLMDLPDVDLTRALRSCQHIFKALREVEPNNINKAWNWYVEVQRIFGDDMTDYNYELFWRAFLRGNAWREAQTVFGDMLHSDKFKRNFQKDEKNFHRQITTLAKSAKSTDQVHQMFRSLLKTLPAYFNKGLFFNTWLERLLDKHDTKATLMVVELAYESNCVPAPRILDEVLNSWVGAQPANPRHLALAEEIALRMVVQRLEVIRKRDSDPRANDGAVDRNLWQKSEIWKSRPVPPATSETFSVLLALQFQRMRKHGMTHKVKAGFEILLDNLRKCELPPESKGLTIILQYHLQNHNLRMVKATFMDYLKNRPSYCWPDEASIVILWNASYLSISRRGSDFMKHEDHVKLRAADIMEHTLFSNPTKKMMSPRITNMMIKCFCGSEDYGGALMALRVLADRFGVFPTPKMIEIIASSVASIAFHTRSPQQRRIKTHSHLFQADAAQLVEIMSQMYNLRVQTELQSGQRVDDARRARLMLETLTKFLLLTMLRTWNPQKVEGYIQALRKKWGAEDCSAGEQTALETYVELYMSGALNEDGEIQEEASARS